MSVVVCSFPSDRAQVHDRQAWVRGDSQLSAQHRWQSLLPTQQQGPLRQGEIQSSLLILSIILRCIFISLGFLFYKNDFALILFPSFCFSYRFLFFIFCLFLPCSEFCTIACYCLISTCSTFHCLFCLRFRLRLFLWPVMFNFVCFYFLSVFILFLVPFCVVLLLFRFAFSTYAIFGVAFLLTFMQPFLWSDFLLTKGFIYYSFLSWIWFVSKMVVFQIFRPFTAFLVNLIYLFQLIF